MASKGMSRVVKIIINDRNHRVVAMASGHKRCRHYYQTQMILSSWLSFYRWSTSESCLIVSRAHRRCSTMIYLCEEEFRSETFSTIKPCWRNTRTSIGSGIESVHEVRYPFILSKWSIKVTIPRFTCISFGRPNTIYILIGFHEEVERQAIHRCRRLSRLFDQ